MQVFPAAVSVLMCMDVHGYAPCACCWGRESPEVASGRTGTCGSMLVLESPVESSEMV